MVRAPCCEKMGLKKGQWTAEEDQILVSYIHRHGHGNWRALPKQAGLLRCGKSCRLRWINYLRPNIKRGNFTLEDEEAIIKLHEMLGNRWSAIAAKLPGRTDNEIKNIWHTYLKKRVSCPDSSSSQETKRKLKTDTPETSNITITTSTSSLQSSFSADRFSNSSSGTTTDVSSDLTPVHRTEEEQNFLEIPVIDESFWSEEHLLMEEGMTNRASTDLMESEVMPLFSSCGVQMNEDMEFWLKMLLEAGNSSWSENSEIRGFDF